MGGRSGFLALRWCRRGGRLRKRCGRDGFRTVWLGLARGLLGLTGGRRTLADRLRPVVWLGWPASGGSEVLATRLGLILGPVRLVGGGRVSFAAGRLRLRGAGRRSCGWPPSRALRGAGRTGGAEWPLGAGCGAGSPWAEGWCGSSWPARGAFRRRGGRRRGPSRRWRRGSATRGGGVRRRWGRWTGRHGSGGRGALRRRAGRAGRGGACGRPGLAWCRRFGTWSGP
jgi:hypothetical protein